MKKTFPEHYKPTDDEFKSLWKKALFAFDASVLLDIVRFKKSSADEIIEVIRKLEKQAWVPHQAASEFLSNRYNVFLGLVQPYSILKTFLSETSSAVVEKIVSVSELWRYRISGEPEAS